MISRIIIGLSFVFCTTLAHATNYYVNNFGNDQFSGVSQKTPWKTISRANRQQLYPGDKILLEGQQTFLGTFFFPATRSGIPGSPITISSYGEGQAIVSSGAESGFVGYNVSWVNVSNIRFIGNLLTNTNSGIIFYTDDPDGAGHINITSVESSLYQLSGIEFSAWGTENGYHDVTVSSSKTHHNSNGFFSFADRPEVNRNINVYYTTASFNRNSGIILGDVATGAVEFSQVFENGTTTNKKKSPSGISTYDSTQIIFHNNVSHHNHTPGLHGHGFLFGTNVSYSTMQYNNSYNNDGAGYVLAHGLTENSMNNDELLLNVSTDDCRKGGYAAIQLWGRIRDTVILNNVVHLTPTRNDNIAAIGLANWGAPNACIDYIIIRGNNFDAIPHLVNVTPEVLNCSARLKFEGNTYQGNPFSIIWGNNNYSTLSSWTAATGQN